MHELSIAMRVVETLTEDLAEQTGEITLVRLRVGALSCVVPDALRFAWDIACQDTRLCGSALEIEEVDVQIWCELCGREQQVPPGSFTMRCSICGAAASRVVSGRELEILSVEMTEHDESEVH